MSNAPTFPAPSWPTNIGPWNTGWQRVEVICDWLDTDLLFDAITDLNPLNATPTYRVIAAFDFMTDVNMVAFRLKNPTFKGLEWDIERCTADLDPCFDPDATDRLIETEYPGVSLSMATIYEIDMRDEDTYHQFLAACEDRLPQFQGMAPCVGFIFR